jgi:hypothetical protein
LEEPLSSGIIPMLVNQHNSIVKLTAVPTLMEQIQLVRDNIIRFLGVSITQYL